MTWTTPLEVVRFTHATYADVRSESVGTGDGVETNFYVQNKPIWGSGSVSVFVGTTLQNSTAYTVDNELGKVQFTAAVANGSGVTAHYTYSSISSVTMNDFVTFAENYIVQTINNTTNSTQMELYANLIAAHLLMKNLAALRSRDGITNYTIGYISVGKGDKEMEMANVYWNNFTQLTRSQVALDTVRVTFRHTNADEDEMGYFNRELVEDQGNP